MSGSSSTDDVLKLLLCLKPSSECECEMGSLNHSSFKKVFTGQCSQKHPAFQDAFTHIYIKYLGQRLCFYFPNRLKVKKGIFFFSAFRIGAA